MLDFVRFSWNSVFHKITLVFLINVPRRLMIFQKFSTHEVRIGDRTFIRYWDKNCWYQNLCHSRAVIKIRKRTKISEFLPNHCKVRKLSCFWDKTHPELILNFWMKILARTFIWERTFNRFSEIFHPGRLLETPRLSGRLMAFTSNLSKISISRSKN